jgi:hypothetical protein
LGEPRSDREERKVVTAEGSGTFKVMSTAIEVLDLSCPSACDPKGRAGLALALKTVSPEGVTT